MKQDPRWLAAAVRLQWKTYHYPDMFEPRTNVGSEGRRQIGSQYGYAIYSLAARVLMGVESMHEESGEDQASADYPRDWAKKWLSVLGGMVHHSKVSAFEAVLRSGVPDEPLEEWVRIMVRDALECPCCGDVGAWPSKVKEGCGWYFDGDPLVCGCEGCVFADAEDSAHVSVDIPCDACGDFS